MTTETMNTALADLQLCWTLGPGGPVLVDGGHEWASGTARNVNTLEQYVAIAVRKGKTEAELAATRRAFCDGNHGPWDALLEGPDA